MTDDAPRFRLRIIGVISISLFVALGSRLWYLQVLNTTDAIEQVAENTKRFVNDPAPRGRILDVNGKVLVENKVVTVVTVDKTEWNRAFPKKKADERRAAITKLAVEISRSGKLAKVAEIERLIDNAGSIGKATIATDVDRDLLLYIGERADEFPGVAIASALVRDYPYGDLAAHVLGYVGRISAEEYQAVAGSKRAYRSDDEIGKTGIEKIFEDDLRGTPGATVFVVDAHERVLREETDQRVDPVPGNDVWLSIDIDVQRLVERELADALVQARAQVKRGPEEPDITAPAGAAVVLDPMTGAVRAMASYPTYAPDAFVGGISSAKYAELVSPASYAPLTNRALSGTYAPGSTFKLLTAYAAVNGGFMGQGRLPGIESRAYDNGSFDLAKFTKCEGEKCVFTNARDGRGIPMKYTEVDLRKALAVSSDTYFYRIGAEIGLSKNDRAIQDTAELFGLGRVTGVQLPDEAGGFIPDAATKKERNKKYPAAFPDGDWRLGDDINLSVGQGDVLVTPLQLANAYATFGNGGRVLAPNIASKVTRLDGSVVREFAPRELQKIELSPDARQPVVEGLLGVAGWRDPATGEQGTAYNAFADVGFDLEQWPVVSKTGTAEVQGKADTAVYAAYGPSPDPAKPNTAGVSPRYAMSVVLEQSGFGGANAAPVVAKVFAKLFTNTVEKAYSERVLSACAVRTQAQIAAAAAAKAATTTVVAGRTAPATTVPGGKPATTTTMTAGAKAPATTATATTTTLRIPLLRDGETCP
jgi:penicillin-binding protein 2